jgi:hypothetical protein
MKFIKLFCSRPIFIVALIFFTDLAEAQQNEKDNFGAIIKLTPSSLLTPETPTMQLGAEFLLPKFAKHGVSIEFDYGFRCTVSHKDYPYNNGSFPQLDPPNFYNKHYSKYRIEIRKYFNPKKKLYVAAQGFYIPYTFQVKEGQYVGRDGLAYVFDDAHVSKDISGGAIKFGYVLRFKFPLTLEVFGGVGLRVVNQTYFDFTNRQLYNGSNYKYDKYNDNTVQEGEKILFHIALGISIGYRIF